MIACYCSYDMPSVFSAVVHTARKQHKCGECRGPIAHGERYERVWGVWDGEPRTHRTCCRCLELREWVQAHVPCFCWGYEDMLNDVRETALEYASDAPGFLFGAYRRIIKIKRTATGAIQKYNFNSFGGNL